MNDRMIMLKAGNIGFDSLRVTQARFDCCGAIVKYRTDRVAAEEMQDIEMGCPFCEGAYELAPNSWNLDGGLDIEYAHQPDGYPDMNMGGIEDQMREKLEMEAEDMDTDTFYCEHCGNDEQMVGQLKESNPDLYQEMMDDRMYGQTVECPMCQYGEYDGLQSHIDEAGERPALEWARYNDHFEDDQKIMANRILQGHGSIDKPPRGRPTIGQMRARKRIRDLPAMGYDSLGEVPYGKELEDAVEMYNRKYGPDSMDKPLYDRSGARVSSQRFEGPTMPELRVPEYNRFKDRLLQGGY